MFTDTASDDRARFLGTQTSKLLWTKHINGYG